MIMSKLNCVTLLLIKNHMKLSELSIARVNFTGTVCLGLTVVLL